MSTVTDFVLDDSIKVLKNTAKETSFLIPEGFTPVIEYSNSKYIIQIYGGGGLGKVLYDQEIFGGGFEVFISTSDHGEMVKVLPDKKIISAKITPEFFEIAINATFSPPDINLFVWEGMVPGWSEKDDEGSIKAPYALSSKHSLISAEIKWRTEKCFAQLSNIKLFTFYHQAGNLLHADKGIMRGIVAYSNLSAILLK